MIENTVIVIPKNSERMILSPNFTLKLAISLSSLHPAEF